VKGLSGFFWFGLAVGLAGIIFIPLFKMAFGWAFNRVGATGATRYIDEA